MEGRKLRGDCGARVKKGMRNFNGDVCRGVNVWRMLVGKKGIFN